MDQNIIDEMQFLADSLLFYEYERMGRQFLAYLWLKYLAKKRLESQKTMIDLTGHRADQLD